jgi:hypothetical protein
MAQGAHTSDQHEWRISGNWPPLTRLDIIGILVAGLGTFALIMVAAVSADADAGNYGAVTIARVLIAIAVSLINLAHVVGIFFFESVGYHGPFQQFFARLSLLGTPGALIISLAIGLL